MQVPALNLDLAHDHPFVELLNRNLVSDESTSEERCEAQQKRDFVYSVEQKAMMARMTLEEAVAFTANDAEQNNLYPALRAGGKGGVSRISGKRALANFRGWKSRLGLTEAGATDFENWRALLPHYRGSRGKYVPPGDLRFYYTLFMVILRQSRVSLWRAYTRCRERYLAMFGPAGEAGVPPFAVVKYVHGRIDRKILMASSMDSQRFVFANCSYVSREAPPPGAVWVGDNRTMDLWAQVTDPETGRISAVRPILTAWCDWGSYSMPGWLIRAADADMESAVLALREGVRANRNVPPVYLYIDNGKDFDADEFERVVASLGCVSKRCLPYNPPAKIIERFFRDVLYSLDRWWFSYCGNRPDAKPEWIEDLRTVHPERLPTIEQVRDSFRRFLAEKLSEPSKSKGCGGRSPLEVLAAAPPLRMALDEDSIYEAFLYYVGQRKIRKGGEIEVFGRLYQSDVLFDRFRNDDFVFVKADRDDLSRVHCYTLEGQRVCIAARKPEIPGIIDLVEDPEKRAESREAFLEQQKRRARQTKQLKTAIATLQGATRADTRSTNIPFCDRPQLVAAGSALVSAKRQGSDEPQVHADPDVVKALDQAVDDDTQERLRQLRDGPDPDDPDTA